MDPEKQHDSETNRPFRQQPKQNVFFGIRRSRAIRLFAITCLAFIAFAQWKQLGSRSGGEVITPLRSNTKSLSIERLEADVATCSRLRQKPKDPIGLGREKNARHIDGYRPTLIRNASVWVGEPVEGGAYRWLQSDVFVELGLIKRVSPGISLQTLTGDVLVYEAKGRPLTAGIVDMHSHAGDDSLPELKGSSDDNELSADITPYVRSIDGINPLDRQLQVIKSGGVTTSLVLPGSGNNIGGEAYVIKHAVGRPDGRPEISAADMLADPDRNWRYMKMACGENPKRVYGQIGRGPFSRLGESWFFRHAFEQAAKLVRKQDDWCDAATADGLASMEAYLPQDLEWESLGAVLRGQVHVNTHCYTVPDLEAFVDHTNEFKFPVRAFHHAHQTFLVPEILKRAYGGRAPASALFADNMYYKAEAYIGSEYAGKVLYENGLTPVYVSDNPVLNAQHVVFEAAKAYKYGLPYHAALAGVTTAPAELLGLGARIGKIKPGFDADIVVWDSDPLSVGAAPVQVWIDGTAQFDDPVELEKPVSAPIVPDENLATVVEESTVMRDIVLTGVTKSLLNGGQELPTTDGSTFNVAVTNGKITCIGVCAADIQDARRTNRRVIALKNGHVAPAFTAFGSMLGLNAIDNEDVTDDGSNPSDVFSRAVDGLALDTKKLKVAREYGVTRAITAPKFTPGTHHGVSTGFLTGALTALEKGAVFREDVALHYTLSADVKGDKTPSISSAVGALRRALLGAARSNETTQDPFSEEAYLKKVVAGDLALVLTMHSADAIAAALRVKAEVEDFSGSAIRLVVIGGAESHLVAAELAAAKAGVVLAPFQSYATTWDQRRALTGAPLTNGTAIDALVNAGVVTAIGLEEDWLLRDLGLLAGIAYRNGGGRLSDKEALALVGANVYEMLGLKSEDEGHFVVYEGSPLEIGGRVKAVGDGRGVVSVFG